MQNNTPILEVSHLRKRFGNHEVLSDISFTVGEGDVTCIIMAPAARARARCCAASIL